ncbi:MAG: dynamin family protein [Bacteroidales bacterium]
MNKTTKSYCATIENSFNLSEKFLLPTALAEVTTERNRLLSILKSDANIKMPIIGDFSAGKTSLINTYIDRQNLLPVDITPETAVAYELYYSDNEYVELFRSNNPIKKCDLQDIKKLAVEPGDIAKVYINSTAIKRLNERGIVLVDMPGIDSGIQAHNDAILNYIDKGSVFIMMMDIEQGTRNNETIIIIVHARTDEI